MLFVALMIASSLVSPNAAYADTSIDEPFKKLFSGIASWYGGNFHGKRTASGSKYNMHEMTCAHKTLPFGTKLIVENTTNGKSCQVTVTDRGPYHGKRVLDLSKAAADRLELDGIGNVVCYLAKVVTRGIGGTAKGISGTAKSMSGVGRGKTTFASKPMNKQEYRKQIERYYANKTLSFESNESQSQLKGTFEPRARAGCLLVPDSGIADSNRAGKTVLAGLEQSTY